MAGGPKPFPLEAPIRPEQRQIGRGPAIDALERQVIDLEHHTLLLAERHVGKTSMAWAVQDRVRASGTAWPLDINLAFGPIRTGGALAATIAQQARAASVRVEGSPARLRDRLRGAAQAVATPALGAAARLLDIPELEDVATIAASVDEILAATTEDGPPDLRTVLNAVQAAAIAAGKPVLLFIDEAQRLATDWEDPDDSLAVQEALAELMAHPEGRVVLLLAGSERRAVEELLASDKPLHRDGMGFEVRPIAEEDWQHGLTERFTEVGIEVTAGHIDQILAASGGHPQRTMRVCAHVQELVAGTTFDVSELVIDEAIAAAMRHPSWQT